MKKICNIINYKLLNNKELIVINTNHDIYFNAIEYIDKIAYASDIYQVKKHIIISENYYGKGFILNEDFKIEPFLNAEYSISKIEKNYAIIYQDIDNKSFYGIYDFNLNIILFNRNKYLKQIFMDYVCGQDGQIIILYDIYTGNPLWQFSIADFPPYINGFYREQEADIKQIIGVYNNLLWVHVGGLWLIGIDIKTGKLVHKIENIVKGDSRHNFLDVTNGVLKTLGYDYYAEFDLKTLQFRKQTTVQNKENIRIRASNFYEGDKCLYFCGYYNNDFNVPNVFGIFDTEKAEIVWYDTTKDDLGYFYNPPQANDKLLAVLDDKHNLLVYERDELK